MELAETNVLCGAAHYYFTRHGVLPTPLREPGLFHHINATTTALYLRNQTIDADLYNYQNWCNALVDLDSPLAPYMHDQVSLSPSPHIPSLSPTVPPLGNSPYPRPQLLIRMATEDDDNNKSDSDEENNPPDDPLLRDWLEYNPTDTNHYPVKYTDEWGWSKICKYIRYTMLEGIPTIQGCDHPTCGVYGDFLHPRPHPDPIPTT